MIDFYFPEIIYNETSILKEILLIIFGSTIAFFGALFLAKRSFKKHIRFEKNTIKKGYKNKLKYFSLLIEGVIENTKGDIDNYEKVSNEIFDEPAEFHYLIKKASADIERLQKLNPDEIFKAYMDLIPESDNRIVDFKKIYYAIDFIYQRTKLIFNSNEKQINYIHKDQLFIQEKTIELENELVRLIKSIETSGIQHSKDKDYIFLTESHTYYVQLTEEGANTTRVIEKFTKPFSEVIRKSHSQKDYFEKLFNLTNIIIIRYNHIIFNSKTFAEELKGLRGEFSNSLNKLEEMNSLIKDQIL